MSLTKAQIEEIKVIVRDELCSDSLREIVRDEVSLQLMTLHAKQIPLISQQEQDEIEKLYADDPGEFEATETIEIVIPE